MYGAGLMHGGRTYDGLMHVSDILPTLLSAAGVKIDSSHSELDGMNQWDAIADGGASPRSEVLIQSDPLPIEYDGKVGDSAKAAIRVGAWKLIVGSAGCPDNWLEPYHTYGSGPLTAEAVHNCARAPAGHVQLYNVVDDAEE